ncbi:MAG: extracellular solute-binding protein [Ardenticatenaceae bacterium]|nr:extracellular solute-binding protein [Ardenticatenaceae bacterium]
MKKALFYIVSLFVFGLVLAACQPQTVEVTRVVTETEEVEVTRVVTETVVEEGEEVEVTRVVEVPAESEVITIEYWQYFFDARVDAMNRLIQQFEAENPDVRVIHNSDIPYADFRDKIAASAPANVGPDVATLFYGWIPAWVDAGYLIPLPEEVYTREEIAEQFSPMVLQSELDGEFWAVPTAVRTLALFWNKDLFEAAGLDPEQPPTNLDELVEMAQLLTEYDDAGNILIQGFPVAPPGQAHHWFREVLVRQYGGVPYSEDNRTVLYNSPEGCEAFTYMVQFETELNTGSNDLFEDATQAFLQGKSAIHIDGSFRIGSIATNAPDLNYGVIELPVTNDIQSTFGSYWTHGITRKAAEDPARLDASIRFLKFITTAESGAIWVDKVGELPAQLTAAADEDLLADPILGPFAAGLPYANATFFVDESEQRQVIIDAYDAVRLTDADPCEALNEAAEREQALLDEFWADR